VKGDTHKMIGHLEELREIWDTLDICYERPEKYMEEALKPILELRKYRLFYNGAIREFYSILRATIKGAKSIGRLDILINNQTAPKIMGKMPFSDWKEWATKRPERVRGDLGVAFEGFMERKWRDALNVAAAEPRCLGAEGAQERQELFRQVDRKPGDGGEAHPEREGARQDSGGRQRGHPAAALTSRRAVKETTW
jgi:hypothetical protein